MILKLLKSYNLLFLLIAVLLSGSTSLYAQVVAPSKPGAPARFGIDGDVNTNVGVDTNGTSILIDDWFNLSNGLEPGFPMIDGTDRIIGTEKVSTQLKRGDNISFEVDPAFSQYDVQNNSLLYDAVYARDYLGNSGEKERTMFGTSAKHAEDPNNWSVTESSLSGYSVIFVYNCLVLYRSFCTRSFGNRPL